MDKNAPLVVEDLMSGHPLEISAASECLLVSKIPRQPEVGDYKH